MFEIPKHIEGIVKSQARRYYNRHYYFVRKWSDVNDFVQNAYLELHRKDLWCCEDRAFIYIIVRSACIDYIRQNISGFRKRKPLNLSDLHNAWMGVTDGGLNDEVDQKLSLQQMLDYLPKIKQYVVQSIIEGKQQREVGLELGLTESRISQIKNEIIEKLLEIETGRKVFRKIKKEPISEIRSVDFKGFCLIHRRRKIFNKKRRLCLNCYVKLQRLNMLKLREVEFMPYLKRRLRRGEEREIARLYGKNT